eukprot:scaffold93048_cov34-Tisochrysis_lutea.AAC.2
MARAAGSMVSRCRAAKADGMATVMGPTGRLQPITPVDAGMTDLPPPGSSRAAATASQSDSESATPSRPEQTFEILLLMIIACSGAPASIRSRPILMGAPQKELRVSTAAQL